MNIILIVTFTVCFCLALKKPDDISDEMYCMGCEVIVKELDFMLSFKPTRGMGETVTRVLDQVCDVNIFKKYDVDSKKVLQVCKHIKGDSDMEAALTSKYGRKHETGKQTTYLEMTKLICGTILKACREPQNLGSNEEDLDIIFDPATQDFIVKSGKKVRTVVPIAVDNSEVKDIHEVEVQGKQAQQESNIESVYIAGHEEL